MWDALFLTTICKLYDDRSGNTCPPPNKQKKTENKENLFPNHSDFLLCLCIKSSFLSCLSLSFTYHSFSWVCMQFYLTYCFICKSFMLNHTNITTQIYVCVFNCACLFGCVCDLCHLFEINKSYKPYKTNGQFVAYHFHLNRSEWSYAATSWDNFSSTFCPIFIGLTVNISKIKWINWTKNIFFELFLHWIWVLILQSLKEVINSNAMSSKKIYYYFKLLGFFYSRKKNHNLELFHIRKINGMCNFFVILYSNAERHLIHISRIYPIGGLHRFPSQFFMQSLKWIEFNQIESKLIKFELQSL